MQICADSWFDRCSQWSAPWDTSTETPDPEIISRAGALQPIGRVLSGKWPSNLLQSSWVGKASVDEAGSPRSDLVPYLFIRPQLHIPYECHSSADR